MVHRVTPCNVARAHYTSEAELVALSEGIKESEWVWHLLNEIGFKLDRPIQVWCDSTSAISTVNNPGNHKASKHVEVRYLFARDIMEKGRIKLDFVQTQEMLADTLTKALPTKPFVYLRDKLGVKDLRDLLYNKKQLAKES